MTASGVPRDGAGAPFFVVGAERSGTTMLRLMLNSHPNLAVPFESGFIPTFHARLSQYGDLRDRGSVERLVRDIAEFPAVKKGGLIPDVSPIVSRPIASYADVVDAIFSEYARSKGKPRWGDKTPEHVLDIDLLWRLFPGCRIVHLVRDGRDVALSLRELDWGSRHLPRVAQDWLWKTTIARKVGGVLGPHYCEVHYEDLVLQTEATLRRLCGFLGESFHPDMLTYFQTAEREMPRESMQWHRNSTSAPNPSKVYLWKEQMSEADRIIFEQVAGPGLEAYGYERENRRSTWRSRLKNAYYLAVLRW